MGIHIVTWNIHMEICFELLIEFFSFFPEQYL